MTSADWIPVEQRLPEETGWYLVSWVDANGLQLAGIGEWSSQERDWLLKRWAPGVNECSRKYAIIGVTHWQEIQMPEKKKTATKVA